MHQTLTRHIKIVMLFPAHLKRFHKLLSYLLVRSWAPTFGPVTVGSALGSLLMAILSRCCGHWTHSGFCPRSPPGATHSCFPSAALLLPHLQLPQADLNNFESLILGTEEDKRPWICLRSCFIWHCRVTCFVQGRFLRFAPVVRRADTGSSADRRLPTSCCNN